MAKKKANTAAKGRVPKRLRSAGAFIVLGDYMIDQTWLLAGLPSPTAQAHANIKPLKRVSPTWKCQRLGGAGMACMALRAALHRKGLKHSIHALGVWDRDDQPLLDRLASEGFPPSTEATIQFCPLDLAPRDPNKVETIPITVWKTRYSTHLADDRPELIARYDQDPEKPYAFAPDPLASFKSSGGLKQDDVIAVVVADFNKGAASREVLKNLVNWLGDRATDVAWLCDTKGTKIIDALPENARAILSLNRDDAVNLAYRNVTDRLPIPSGDQPNLELLTAVSAGVGQGAAGLDRFGTDKDRVSEIYVKLDAEGAAAFRKNARGDFRGEYCALGKAVKTDGIAAGDFFNSSLLVDVVNGVFNLKTRIANACAYASGWLKYSALYWTDSEIRGKEQSDIVQAGYFAQYKRSTAIVRQCKQLQKVTSFALMRRLNEREQLHDYTEIKKLSRPQIVLKDATGFLGDFGATDPILRRDIREFVDQIESYTLRVGPARPLNCLVVASPGSGKTFFAGEVSKKLECDLIAVNCSQMHDGRDLLRAIAGLQNAHEEKTPLLFLDEVDAREDFYPMLLAPLWDAEAVIDGERRRWRRKTVAILVASNASGPDHFIDHLRISGVNKGLDLASRLQGPKLSLSERSRTSTSLTNRIYMMVSMLIRHHRGARLIHQGVPDLLYAAKRYNARALEQYVLSMDPPNNGVLELNADNPSQMVKLEQFVRDLGYNVGTKRDLRLDPDEVACLTALEYRVTTAKNEIPLSEFTGAGTTLPSKHIRIRE